jgi:hypothetical protein
MNPIQITRTTVREGAPPEPVGSCDGPGVPFLHYDPADGRIVQTGNCAPFDLEHQTVPGCARLAGEADLHADYVDLSGPQPAVRRRPPAPASLLALPVPATVTVRSNALGTSETYTVEDGSFEYSDAPGRYTITVQAWPHRDATFEVEL